MSHTHSAPSLHLFIALLSSGSIKMAKFSNPYHNFIDLLTKEGQALFSNATDKFKSPLQGNNKISHRPGGQDYQKMKDALSCLSQQFGYTYLLNNVVTIQDANWAVLAIALKPPAVSTMLTAAAIPELITYTNEIKILDFCSNQTLEISQKNTLITWGNKSFTNKTPTVFLDLTQADGHLTTTGRPTHDGKEIATKCILSKIMAYQVLELLTDDADQMIEMV